MDREKLIELIDSNGRFNLPTTELEHLADHLIANGIGDIADLKAENEALRKQLENSAQLPCKVGGVIYWVTEGNDVEGREFYYIDEGIVEWVMVNKDGTYWIYVKYDSGMTYQHHIEKTTQEDNLYQSLSEAEARLNELQGEQK